MDRRVWLSRRALKLHAVILVVVPAFMALCIWQITRALDGNSLSWAYVFEWPIFAGYAVYMWWRFVHEADEVEPPPASAEHGAGGPETDSDTGSESAARREKQEKEDEELAAYNEYLARLAERDRAAER